MARVDTKILLHKPSMKIRASGTWHSSIRGFLHSMYAKWHINPSEWNVGYMLHTQREGSCVEPASLLSCTAAQRQASRDAYAHLSRVVHVQRAGCNVFGPLCAYAVHGLLHIPLEAHCRRCACPNTVLMPWPGHPCGSPSAPMTDMAQQVPS